MENIVFNLDYKEGFKESLYSYITAIHNQYPVKSGGDGFVGRSTLKEQLANISDYEIRDCKLRTFICAKGLQQANIDTRLVTFCNGPHPFVLVPLMINGKYNELSHIAKITLHPNESGFEVYRFAGALRTWGEVINFPDRFRMQIHPLDEQGIQSLDRNYLTAVEQKVTVES